MKKLIALTIGIMMTLPTVMGTAYAADFKCADVNQSLPTKEDATSTKKEEEKPAFFVILEEPIGGPDAMYCFRVCGTNPDEKSKTVAKRICKIQEKCDKGSDFHKDEKISCQRIQIVAADSGMDLLSKYVRMIYLWAAGTIGIFAVLTIVVSGVQMMATGGSGNIDTAKQRITQALVGLIVLFLSGLILYTINPNFFV